MRLALKTLILCALSLLASPAAAQDISITAIQTQLEKAALGVAIKMIPLYEDESPLWAPELTWSKIPVVDVSAAGGDAFAHIRLAEVFNVRPAPNFDHPSCGSNCWNWSPMFQFYGGYEADTDFGDAAVIFGAGIVPIAFHPDAGGEPFGYGANKLGLFFEVGEKISDPTQADGGKLDSSDSRAGSAIYRLRLDAECSVGLYPNVLTYCTHEAGEPNSQRLFLATQADGWYDFSTGRVTPQVKVSLNYIVETKYATTFSIGYEYGSGPPTFNTAGQVTAGLTTKFFDHFDDWFK